MVEKAWKAEKAPIFCESEQSSHYIMYPYLSPFKKAGRSIKLYFMWTCNFLPCDPWILFSLGGFTALVTAAELPEQVLGVALLNSAGQFGNPSGEVNNTEETALQKFLLKPLKEVVQRVVLGFLFWQAKQPARIESVLKSVC